MCSGRSLLFIVLTTTQLLQLSCGPRDVGVQPPAPPAPPAGRQLPSAAELARLALPTFYQRRATDEDRFVAAIDYAACCDPLGFTPAELPPGVDVAGADPTSIVAARTLLAVGASAGPPPASTDPGIRLRLMPPDGNREQRADRVARMRPKHGPVIYASVRPLTSFLPVGRAPERRANCEYRVVAYFVFLPFNRAPLAEPLRLLKTFDHEGDLETVQEAVEIDESGTPRVLQVAMGNHGRRIVALPPAFEYDDRGGPGVHLRIWFDEGSHEPYPFRSSHGVFTSMHGVFYTPKRGDAGGLRDAFLDHDAEPEERNAIRPSDLRLLPPTRLRSAFSLAAFLKQDVREQDVEFLMRYPGSYGADDSPAGPPWNMWDLFDPGGVDYQPAPAGRP